MLQTTGRIATRGNDAVDPQSGTESGTAPADATTTALLAIEAFPMCIPSQYIREFWTVVRTPQTLSMPAVIAIGGS